MAGRSSFGKVADCSGATSQGSVNDKKTRETGDTPADLMTGSLHEVPGTGPEDDVVVHMDTDPDAIGHATIKLNDPPVDHPGQSTTWSLPAWEQARTGLCTVATAVVGGAGMAAAMATDETADLAAKVLLPLVALVACGFSGWLASHACPKSPHN